MANILVTGGSGFIGSFLVERLVQDGYDVTEFNYADALKEETALIETELAQAELNDNGNLNTDESDTQGYKENGTKTTPFRITPTILIFIGVLIFAVIVVILLKRKK